MKYAFFLGDSRNQSLEFPMDARPDAGCQIDKVQQGKEPGDYKPRPSMGPGVREIRLHAAGEHQVVDMAKSRSKPLLEAKQ